MNCPHASKISYPKTKPTWRMNRIELAKVWADHNGIHTHTHGGGWLYTESDRPYVQGWHDLATRLERAGTIVVGTGIRWNR